MAMAGAPKGNRNAAKGKLWRQALREELALLVLDNGKPAGSALAGLRAIAARVVKDAYNGNYKAIAEIGNREDGKAAQGVYLAGEDGSPIQPNTISDLELARRILFDLHEAERSVQQQQTVQ